MENILCNYSSIVKRKASIDGKGEKRGKLEHCDRMDVSDMSMWVNKYRPISSKDILGNITMVAKLKDWLRIWLENEIPEERSVLISGPPGIGKTTMAKLVPGELGFHVFEYNASDVRSKKRIQDSLGGFLDNRSMVEYNSRCQRPLIVMDEIDGMSSGDRGGLGELNNYIRKARVPVICICNDRSQVQIRAIAGKCLDLRLRRPDNRKIFSHIKSICQKEHVSVEDEVIYEALHWLSGDIRQALSLFYFLHLGGKRITLEDVKAARLFKDVSRGPFDVINILLNNQKAQEESIRSLEECYFVDPNIVPLMFHENYLNTGAEISVYHDISESISQSDIVDRSIHGSDQNWMLMPLHCFLSVVYPSVSLIGGRMKGRVAFPGWLGENSKKGRKIRLLKEMVLHSSMRLGLGLFEFRSEYIFCLLSMFVALLNKKSGIERSIDMLDYYYLLKDDLDNMFEFGVGVLGNAKARIPTTVKTSFTKIYNSRVHHVPYVLNTIEEDEEEDNNVGKKNR